MREKFALFTRCLGLTLVSCGLLLALRTTVCWLQPSPDLSAVWNQLGERLPGSRLESVTGPKELLEQAQTRAFLTDLLTYGVFPSVLGLLLILRAPAISAWCCRGDGPARVEVSETQRHAESAPSMRHGEAEQEAPDSQYAPPGLQE
jgi:hypothetical protein